MSLRRSNHNNIKNQWLAVLFLLIPGIVFSAAPSQNRNFEDERWFEVELIIFAHNNKEALESEDWPKITGLLLPDELVELSLPDPEPPEEETQSPATQEPAMIFEPVTQPIANGTDLAPGDAILEPVPMPVAFEILPDEELQLKDAFKKLQRSRDFEPMLHVAWRQPTFERKRAQTVLLYDSMTEPVPEMTEDIKSIEAGKKKRVDEKASVNNQTEEGPRNPNFVGTVQLSVARYLHLAADLVYRTPVTERVAIPLPDLELWYDRPYPTLTQHQGPAYQLEQWNAVQGFRLEESRRMRSKKIHYLDHPFFGVVVLITPVELPKDPEVENIPDPMRSISSPDN